MVTTDRADWDAWLYRQAVASQLAASATLGYGIGREPTATRLRPLAQPVPGWARLHSLPRV